MIKLKPYSEAILQSEQDEATALAPARAEETKAQLGMKNAQVSIAVRKQELAVTEISGRYPLDIQGLCAALDELTLLRFLQQQLTEVTEQLFPKV